MNDLSILKYKKIRLAALDLDGTVLTDDKRVTRRTRSAIERAAEAGVTVVVVTGRPLAGIPEAVQAIQGIRYYITSNGAVVSEIQSGRPQSFSHSRTLHADLLDPHTAEEITRLALDRGILYSVYIGGTGYCDQACFDGRLELYEGTPVGEYIHQSVRVTDDVPGFIRSSFGVENIWLQEKDTVLRDHLNSLIRQRWDVNTVLTSPTDVEIGSPVADKGRALEWLSERLGIIKDQILAIGDNFNDLEMFRASGTAAAMGNAPQDVKYQAAFAAPSNEEDGVAAVLEQLI